MPHCWKSHALAHLKTWKINFSYVCRTDPADVARVESKTWMCTVNKYDSVPHVREGAVGILGQWKSPEEAGELITRFDKCMAGMY